MPPVGRSTTFRRALPKRRVAVCSTPGCAGALAYHCRCLAAVCAYCAVPERTGAAVLCSRCARGPEPRPAA